MIEFSKENFLRKWPSNPQNPVKNQFRNPKAISTWSNFNESNLMRFFVRNIIWNPIKYYSHPSHRHHGKKRTLAVVCKAFMMKPQNPDAVFQYSRKKAVPLNDSDSSELITASNRIAVQMQSSYASSWNIIPVDKSASALFRIKRSIFSGEW